GLPDPSSDTTGDESLSAQSLSHRRSSQCVRAHSSSCSSPSPSASPPCLWPCSYLLFPSCRTRQQCMGARAVLTVMHPDGSCPFLQQAYTFCSHLSQCSWSYLLIVLAVSLQRTSGLLPPQCGPPLPS